MKPTRTYPQALTYLYSYIPQDIRLIHVSDFGLSRTKYLLKLLGNPQNQIKVLHIAGTSGKGSTAFFLSHLLSAAGFKVGLHVSPYLLDIREAYQLNNSLLGKAQFTAYVNELIPALEKMRRTKYGSPTYFEISVALAYTIFAREKVDYAVMETGLGGLFDATNVVSRPDKINIITSLGHDHTKILGQTLDKIAFQKLGIVQPGNTVVTTTQHSRARKVIETEVAKKAARLFVIGRQNITHSSLLPAPKFDFKFQDVNLPDIRLRMLGSFQIQNCSLALATVILLANRDKFTLDPQLVKTTLGQISYPGRMQKIMTHHQTFILDGAHNPQKMKAFIQNLQLYFPGQKFTFLLSFKKGKDYRNILRFVTPLAQKTILTSFSDQTKLQGHAIGAEDPDIIAAVLTKLGYKNFTVCKNSQTALNLLFSNETIKVITGSLYLLSELYPKIIKS